jgi:hypothetical protein
MDFYQLACIRSEDITSSFSYSKFYYADGRRKTLTDQFIQQLFESYRDNYPHEFNCFLKNKSEKKEVEFGLNQKGSLSESILKSKDKNCSKCYQWAETDYCPIKPISLNYLNDKILLDSVKMNLCDHRLKYGPSR